mgnify:CR=1 FL=1
MDYDLSQLLEARCGQPSEPQAVRKIATFAVIPAAVAGLLVGSRLIGLGDPTEKLVLVCVAMACGAGFGALCLVLAVHTLFGFRPVSLLADALIGGFFGLLGGACLCMVALSLTPLSARHALLPLLLIPLGAVVAPFFLPKRDRVAHRDPTHARETPASPHEPSPPST